MKNLADFKKHQLDKKACEKIRGGTSNQQWAWENAANHGGCPPPEHN